MLWRPPDTHRTLALLSSAIASTVASATPWLMLLLPVLLLVLLLLPVLLLVVLVVCLFGHKNLPVKLLQQCVF